LTTRGGLGWIAAVSLCVAIYASLLLVLTAKFESIGMFAQDDVIFDADAHARLRCFAESMGSHCRSFAHPNLGNVVTPVVWAVAALGTVTGSGFVESAYAAGIWIAPASAVGAFLLCLACGVRATGRRWLSLTVAVGYAGSTAATYFGAIPESYGLSAVALWIAVYFALGENFGSARSRLLLWSGIGAIAAGITITNVAWTSLLGTAWALKNGSHPWAAMRFGATSMSLALVITAVLWSASLATIRLVRPDVPKQVTSIGWHASGVTDWVTTWSPGFSVRRTLAVGRLFADAIAAPPVVPVSAAAGSMLSVPWQSRETSLAAVVHACASALAAILLCAAAIGSEKYRLIAVASSLILLGNGLLHLFWGGQPFLYAMHVLPILFTLIWIALSRVTNRENRVVSLLMAGLVLAIVAYNMNHVRNTLQRVDATIAARAG
jgi:hypothetical protein